MLLSSWNISLLTNANSVMLSMFTLMFEIMLQRDYLRQVIMTAYYNRRNISFLISHSNERVHKLLINGFNQAIASPPLFHHTSYDGYICMCSVR